MCIFCPLAPFISANLQSWTHPSPSPSPQPSSAPHSSPRASNTGPPAPPALLQLPKSVPTTRQVFCTDRLWLPRRPTAATANLRFSAEPARRRLSLVEEVTWPLQTGSTNGRPLQSPASCTAARQDAKVHRTFSRAEKNQQRLKSTSIEK